MENSSIRGAFIVVCLVMGVSMHAQSGTYDYRWIQFSPSSFVEVVSPDSATRTVKSDQDLRKDYRSTLRMAMRLVQDYERDGWELYDVQMEKETVFLMRKPKQ